MKTLMLPRRHFLTTTGAALSYAALCSWGRAEEKPAELSPRTIHPYPNQLAWKPGNLGLAKQVVLSAGQGSDAAALGMMKELWERFTFGAAKLTVAQEAGLKPNEFRIANGRVPERRGEATYALTVTGEGVGASAADGIALRHAWFTLLQLLQPREESGGALSFVLPQVEIQDWPALKLRGLHVCVFPESTPLMIEKAIRLAAFFKFSHVIIEFWGMLRLDAMKELSWPQAWSKTEAGKLLSLARGMGMEVIPMFNCWGHGTASRISCGRHVVLDQNPRLAPLFEPDGWTWCLSNPRTQDLLRRVCDELGEFAGPGQYFHIGCDEAYSHATCDLCRQKDRVQLFADHLNALAAHLEKRGRQAIMWGDTLLERAKWPTGFAANGKPSLPTHEAIDRISKKIIIADWHYGVTKGDVPTLAHFHQHGFATLACPWNSGGNIQTLSKAAATHHSLGVLQTTWHHLPQSIPQLAYVANCAWSKEQAALQLRQMDGELARAATASYLRKLAPAGGKFERAGWNATEQPPETN